MGDRVLVADRGVLLVGIIPQSPAAIGGLKTGDIIISIDNQAVGKVEEVQKLVENSQVGSPLAIEVQRNGTNVRLMVKPVPLPMKNE